MPALRWAPMECREGNNLRAIISRLTSTALRSPVVSETEGPAIIGQATLAAKREHKLALMRALHEVRARRLP